MNEKRKTVCLVIPCYNEEDNVVPLLQAIDDATKTLSVEIKKLFIDNASIDRTVEIVENLAARDKSIMAIVNRRNFGTVRSPFNGIMSAPGDAVLLMAADLQDPPSMIPEFVKRWQDGTEVVLGVKPTSKENFFTFMVRSAGYKLIASIVPTPIYQHSTGFGIYDRKFVEVVRNMDDPYPFFRGLPGELGFDVDTIEFEQPVRERGLSKNGFYTLYDSGIVGIISLTNLPIRLFSLVGILLGVFSVFMSIVYLILKLVYWDSFPLGMAPMLIAVLFLFGIQFGFMGFMGEYLAQIHTSVKGKPIVVEKRRINFDDAD